MEKEIIYSLIKYIDEHFFERLSLDELAYKYYCSKRNLMRNFKEVTGMTIHNYICKKKFEYARQLLNEGKSCGYVSDILGYSSQCGFRYSYERYFGVNPIDDRINFKAGNRPYDYHYHNSRRKKKSV